MTIGLIHYILERKVIPFKKFHWSLFNQLGFHIVLHYQWQWIDERNEFIRYHACVDVLFHTCIYIRNEIIHSFPILVPINPKIPRAQDKTMQGVGHNINKICKMSRPISKGVLWGLTKDKTSLPPSREEWSRNDMTVDPYFWLANHNDSVV
jgi:uncharacterized membrane protein